MPKRSGPAVIPAVQLDTPSSSMKGRGRRNPRKLVPAVALDAFLENEFTSRLYDAWEERAYDMLPQFEGVVNGDWERLYDMDNEFPQLKLLSENYGQKWKDFLTLHDERDDETVWVISHSIDPDEFAELMDEYYGKIEFDTLRTKSKIDDAIVEFQKFVREKLAEEEGDEDEDE